MHGTDNDYYTFIYVQKNIDILTFQVGYSILLIFVEKITMLKLKYFLLPRPNSLCTSNTLITRKDWLKRVTRQHLIRWLRTLNQVSRVFSSSNFLILENGFTSFELLDWGLVRSQKLNMGTLALLKWGWLKRYPLVTLSSELLTLFWKDLNNPTNIHQITAAVV